jgi:hypothetical protein
VELGAAKTKRDDNLTLPTYIVIRVTSRRCILYDSGSCLVAVTLPREVLGSNFDRYIN